MEKGLDVEPVKNRRQVRKCANYQSVSFLSYVGLSAIATITSRAKALRNWVPGRLLRNDLFLNLQTWTRTVLMLAVAQNRHSIFGAKTVKQIQPQVYSQRNGWLAAVRCEFSFTTASSVIGIPSIFSLSSSWVAFMVLASFTLMKGE